MSIYHIDPLNRDHNKEILEVLWSAPNVTDNLTVCFDRQPDFFRLAEIKYNPYYYYGYFRDKDLKGFCGIGYHNAMVNSRQETVFYMRDYYVLPESRGIGFGVKVAENFFKETYNKTVVGYVVILEGNRASLGYVGRRNALFPYMPYSRIINQLDVRNIMMIWPVRNSHDYIIRKAETKDIAEITELLNNEHKERLFGKIFNENNFQKNIEKCPGLSINDYYLALDRNGKPCGVCAAWDCSSFKQTRVLRYGKRFRILKFLYKGLSVVFNVPNLPANSECFKDIIITDYAARNRDPGIMNALLRRIYNDYRKRGFHNMIWGSSADDPLLRASNGFFYQHIFSNIVLISTNPAMVEPGAIRNNLPYIDVPCL